MKKIIIAIISFVAVLALVLVGKQTLDNQAMNRNKANALAFYDQVFNKHQVRQGTEKYVGKTYIQQNPTVADGGEAFIKAFEPFVKQFPESSATVKRAVAEGDLVTLHVESKTNKSDRGQAVMDIFRFDKDGKIVEHWDVAQDIPEKTASGHSMF